MFNPRDESRSMCHAIVIHVGATVWSPCAAQDDVGYARRPGLSLAFGLIAMRLQYKAAGFNPREWIPSRFGLF